MADLKFRSYPFLLVFAVASTLAACDSARGPLSGRITIDGSDTVLPLSKAMAEAFRASNPGVQFAIEFSGTGGGFKKFCAGQLDIADASRPINSAESAQCKAQHIEYIEVPVAFDSVTVAVNAKNTFVDCLTVKELKAVWEPAAEGSGTRSGRASQRSRWRYSVRGKRPERLTISRSRSWAPKAAAETTTRRAKIIRSSSGALRLNPMPWAISRTPTMRLTRST